VRTSPAPVASVPDPAALAAVFGDPSRVRLLTALADGRSLPASVLSAEAGIAPSTASGHLTRLLECGMVRVERSGRHRYYRLADDRVAAVLEAMSQLSPSARVTSMPQGGRARAVREARTCYDHLAGRLGVALTEGLLREGVLVAVDGEPSTRRRAGDRLSAQLGEGRHRLGPRASAVLAGFGIDLDAVARDNPRRALLRACLDWSEQRHHVAGALGAALCARAFRGGWVRRRGPAGRAVELTDAGRETLEPLLGSSYDGADAALR
jgi:DNA-binding transcriptional ArsR family regulator